MKGIFAIEDKKAPMGANLSLCSKKGEENEKFVFIDMIINLISVICMK